MKFITRWNGSLFQGVGYCKEPGWFNVWCGPFDLDCFNFETYRSVNLRIFWWCFYLKKDKKTWK
jgi:hypothetical protein